MNLIEIVGNLDRFNEADTIYAARPCDPDPGLVPPEGGDFRLG